MRQIKQRGTPWREQRLGQKDKHAMDVDAQQHRVDLLEAFANFPAEISGAILLFERTLANTRPKKP